MPDPAYQLKAVNWDTSPFFGLEQTSISVESDPDAELEYQVNAVLTNIPFKETIDLWVYYFVVAGDGPTDAQFKVSVTTQEALDASDDLWSIDLTKFSVSTQSVSGTEIFADDWDTSTYKSIRVQVSSSQLSAYSFFGNEDPQGKELAIGLEISGTLSPEESAEWYFEGIGTLV